MGTSELKSSLNEMIAEIDNAEFLEALHDLLTSRQRNSGELWRALSEEQQSEVMEAYQQSNDPDKLIDHTDVLKRYL